MLLECRDIEFCYPGAAKPILNNLELVIDEPGLHGLFGPSGVGKTSLAKILAGVLHPTSGQIRAQGLQTILYCHNLERLPGWSGVGRHLERVTPAANKALGERLIHQFGLGGCLTRRFNNLSLGQRNRINLIRYLVQDLQMLIMDESLANVDEHTRSIILTTIKEVFPRACFFYISHNIVEVARYCKRIWVLREPGANPQTVGVQGLNAPVVTSESQGILQKIMLEMMNAV